MKIIPLHSIKKHIKKSPSSTAEVAHSAVALSASEFLIAHGRSVFLKPEKAAKVMREASGWILLGFAGGCTLPAAHYMLRVLKLITAGLS